MKPVQVYLGVPQTKTLPVFDTRNNEQVTIKQMIFTNTDATDAKITVTVNTVDVMQNYIVPANETKIIDMTIVLNPNNTLFLQQEKLNAINVMISGVSDPIPTTMQPVTPSNY